MVMHASKIPRLNDGCNDRNQAHSFEETYPSKSHGSSYYDHYEDNRRESPNLGRARDARRHSNKSSYMERTKDRLDKGSSSSPGDRRSNHHSSNSASSRGGAGGSDEWCSQKEKEGAEIQKSALRVCGDWSEHLSTSGKKYYYNYKTEVSKWEKPKEWTDPPQQTKSTVVDAGRQRGQNGRDNKHGYPSSTASKSSEDRSYRHSNDRGSAGGRTSATSTYPTRSERSSNSATYTNTATMSTYSDHRHSRHASGEQNHHNRHGNGGDRGERPSPSQSKTWDYRSGRDSSRGVSDSSYYERYRRRDYPTTPTTRGRSSDYSHTPSSGNKLASHSAAAFNGARATDSQRNDNEDSRQMEDMDISPGSTPTHSRPTSRPNSHQGTPIASTPVSMTTSSSLDCTPRSYASSMLGAISALPPLVSMQAKATPSQDLTQQAIETLQKLHQALLIQRLQQHNTPQLHNATNCSPRIGAETTTVSSSLVSPMVNSSIASSSRVHHHTEDPRDPREAAQGKESPKSDSKSRRESPTPSHSSSSQSLSLSSSLAAAAARKQDSVQLTPTLANYYKEDLIGHVLGWQSDQAERQARQANRYSEEAHSVGSLQCTQVSVELKKARSMVRIAEIQSTLQEQRILFLRQQIKELESMKSMNSFMPYQDT